MVHICVVSSHKPIRIYMVGLILGVNTLYRLFCLFKLFPMVGKGLMANDSPAIAGSIATSDQKEIYKTGGTQITNRTYRVNVSPESSRTYK